MNISKTSIYANMLTLQAEMSLPFEKPFYMNESWDEANSVFDFGCGNAYYLLKLAETNPNKLFFGYEKDTEMRQEAKNVTESMGNIKILDEIDEITTSIDFFIFRLVLLHLDDREIAYNNIKKFGSKNHAVLVLDAYDDYFLCSPTPHKFLSTLASLRSKSKDRDLFEKINEEMYSYGLKQDFSHKILISNAFPHASESMFKYMYYTAELGVGYPLNEEVKSDLLEWWLNPNCYVQYGVFGKIFTNNI